MFGFLCAILCAGCEKSEEPDKSGKEIQAAFEAQKETFIEKEKTDNEITFILHHAAFEEQKVIVDYTVKAEDITDYKDCRMSIWFDTMDAGFGTKLYYEEAEKEYRTVWVYELSEGVFSEKNIGEKVRLKFFFETASYNQGADRTIEFDAEISKVYQSRKVEIQQEISYDGGITKIEALEISPFYTRLLAANEEGFLLNGDDFYLYEIKTPEGEALQPVNGTESALYFSILPTSSSKVFISVVKYKEDMTYNAVSDRLEVEIP